MALSLKAHPVVLHLMTHYPSYLPLFDVSKTIKVSPPAARIAARAAWGQNYLEKGIAAETILGRRGEDRGGEGEGEGEGDGGVAWTARGVGEAEAEAEAEAETQQRGKEETGE